MSQRITLFQNSLVDPAILEITLRTTVKMPLFILNLAYFNLFRQLKCHSCNFEKKIFNFISVEQMTVIKTPKGLS